MGGGLHQGQPIRKQLLHIQKIMNSKEGAARWRPLWEMLLTSHTSVPAPTVFSPGALVGVLTAPGTSQAHYGPCFCTACSLCLGILFLCSRPFLRNHHVHQAPHLKGQHPPTHTHTHHALFIALFLSFYFLCDGYLTNNMFSLFAFPSPSLPHLECKMLEGKGVGHCCMLSA